MQWLVHPALRPSRLAECCSIFFLTPCDRSPPSCWATVPGPVVPIRRIPAGGCPAHRRRRPAVTAVAPEPVGRGSDLGTDVGPGCAPRMGGSPDPRQTLLTRRVPSRARLCDALRKGVDVHVLFVCTGNVCRSPTAERLARAYATRAALPDVVVSSAGTRAVIGHPIDAGAAPVLQRLGGDPSDFTARQLTAKIAMRADLVLTMTEAHRDAVLRQAPRQLNKTFLLTEAARLATDYDARCVADLASLRYRLAAQDRVEVPDPVGCDPSVFEMVGVQIQQLLPPVLELCRGTGS